MALGTEYEFVWIAAWIMSDGREPERLNLHFQLSAYPASGWLRDRFGIRRVPESWLDPAVGGGGMASKP